MAVPRALPTLVERVESWCEAVGVSPRNRPALALLGRAFPDSAANLRPGVDPGRLASWEQRFGFSLPMSVKAWYLLSDGFRGTDGGPLVHPLSSVGPMVPFASFPNLAVQPESWFEIGNPNRETICIDLGYRWPGGDHPLFTSGDDASRNPPRLIAAGFASWFLRLLHRGGAEFWLEADHPTLGDPWDEHKKRAKVPPLADRLAASVSEVWDLWHQGFDDGAIADRLGLSRPDVESVIRHLQHVRPHLATSTGLDVRS